MKLRKEIAEFARGQPEAFVQLHERLVADENAVKARVLKQEEKAKEKVKKEAEAAFKARYPIADELLVDEPPLETPLPPAPDARYRLNLPPTLQPLSAELISLCDFVHTFGEALQISPISLDELRAALLHRGPSALLVGLFGALVRPLLVDGAALDADAALPRAAHTIPEDLGALSVAPPAAGMAAESAWPEIVLCALWARRRRRRRRRRRAARSPTSERGCCHSIRKWRS